MSAIGIDLGTSNTVVAQFKNGAPHTLCDQAGRRLIPSIVSFHPSGTVLVGDSAKMRRFNDGVSTVTGAKRLMGRLWGSPELEEMRKRVPYQLREGKNRTVRALLRGELYSIPELSAFVLRKAKAWAEEALGEPVKEAVITVPANFNELQRQATKLAGELAGLDVLRVLNEPTAAALAYGHIAPAARDEQIAVYDFGGGTFDLTMLRMSERELRVRATAGDMFLGGDDIDLKIATRIAEAYLAKHFYDPRVDTEIFTRIRVAAERLKVDLSADEEATAPLNELMYGPGGKPIQWSYTMKRRELEAVLDPFINQSLKVCQDAMDLLKASPKDFDRVVLVGGTTLSPRVRQRVAEFFGRQPVDGLDPEEAVALGAAISSTMPSARRSKTGVVPAATSANGKNASVASAVASAAAAKTGARPAAAPLETLDDSDLILDEGETAEGYPVRQSFGPGPGEPAADVLLRPPPAMMSGAPAAPRPAPGAPPPVRRRSYVWYGLGVAVVLGTVAVLAVRAQTTVLPVTPLPSAAPIPSASAAPLPSASAIPSAAAVPSASAVLATSAAPSASGVSSANAAPSAAP